jgi:hypothetical protein
VPWVRTFGFERLAMPAVVEGMVANRHPRHRAIGLLTVLIAQQEETSAQCRRALKQHLATTGSPGRWKVLLQVSQSRLANLVCSRDHVLAEVPTAPCPKRKAHRKDV